MKHITITPFGRPVTAGLMAARALAQGSNTAVPVSKWAPLRDLTTARKAFSLSDRDLAVLQALISFLPDDVISPEVCIVFPSNATLSQRAHGMPESTLRRHLAALVAAGVILRHDSPNGKRYATRATEGARAFGFDLSPLARRAEEINASATETRLAEEALQRLRETVVLRLRDSLQLLTVIPDEILGMRKALRRKLQTTELEQMMARLDQLMPSAITEEMSGNDDQNERHIQESYKIPDDTKTPHLEPDLETVLEACPEISSFYPVQNWRDFIEATDRLGPMIGIEAQLLRQTQAQLSPEKAAMTLACILQRQKTIRNPSAYLRTLLKKAGSGKFTPAAMVAGLLRRPGLIC